MQARRATWTEWNLRAEAARATRHLRLPSMQARLALLDRVVAVARDVHSVALDPPALVEVPEAWRRPDETSVFTRSRESAYTSTALLDAEQGLLAAAADGTGPQARATTALDLPEPLPHLGPTTGQRLPTTAPPGLGLAEDQAAAVAALADSGRRVDVLVGPAGAGKTTTLRALRAVWEAAHGPGSVLALAPSAAAARALSAGLGVPAETAAKWDHAHRHGVAGDSNGEVLALRAGQLVLVDEAALAGTLLLDRLAAAAGQAGAKVVLVGDWAQLSAVEAGGAFGLLARHGTPVELGTVHRFSSPWEAEASRRLRAGDLPAIEAYAAHGRLAEGPAEAMAEAAYRAWHAAQAGQAGQAALLIAADNATVAALNARARADRLNAGHVHGPGMQLHDGTHAAAGDLVVSRRNDRRLRPAGDGGRGRGGFVRNGDRWTITAVHPDGALSVVRDGDGGELRLPAEYVAAHVELGYATTAHRAQGATVDAAYAILRPGTARETAYVALTRGRHTNHAYVVTDEPVAADYDGPPGPALTGRQVLERILATTGAEQSATETLRARQDDAAGLARLVPVHATLTAAAHRKAWATRLAGQKLAGMPGARLPESPAFDALVAALRDGQRRGYDMTDVLARLAAASPLADARDPAAVLHDRVTAWLDRHARPGPLPRLLAGIVPTDPLPVETPQELARSVRDLEDLINARARHLALGILGDPPAWARSLGASPRQAERREQWLRHVGVVAAYRDLHAVTTDALLDPEDRTDHIQHQAWRCAAGAAGAARRLAQSARWAPRRSSELAPSLDRSLQR